jgi:hypothetical protein
MSPHEVCRIPPFRVAPFYVVVGFWGLWGMAALARPTPRRHVRHRACLLVIGDEVQAVDPLTNDQDYIENTFSLFESGTIDHETEGPCLISGMEGY